MRYCNSFLNNRRLLGVFSPFCFVCIDAPVKAMSYFVRLLMNGAQGQSLTVIEQWLKKRDTETHCTLEGQREDTSPAPCPKTEPVFFKHLHYKRLLSFPKTSTPWKPVSEVPWASELLR